VTDSGLADGFGDGVERSDELDAEHIVAAPGNTAAVQPLITYLEDLPAVGPVADREFIGMNIGLERERAAALVVFDTIVELPGTAPRRE